MNSIPEIIVRYYVKKYFKDTIKLLTNDFLKSEGYGRLFIHVHSEDNETIRK